MFLVQDRDAPNMLKNLPIIPSRTSQNLSLLFFKIPPVIPKLFCSDSKKIITTAKDYTAIELKTLHRKYLITLRKSTK